MTNLFFKERGKGQAVILLHGFPFNQEIWNNFAEKLAQKFRVFTVDLPGLGKSPILQSPFSIDQVAAQIILWIKENKIENPILIGHSLGGYVTLAAAGQDPDLFGGLVLFHSTAYADNEEKKQSRNKVLEFIDKQGVLAFTSNFINTLFADQHHAAIDKVKRIASQATAEAVKGYTIAMRDRPERTDVLTAFPKSILFLAGDKDGGISVESIYKQAAICLKSETHILPGVAHMGMFENEKKAEEIISSFIEKNTVTK
jgi:pimeloyl-ACP methyl ester carboxylesterase